MGKENFRALFSSSKEADKFEPPSVQGWLWACIITPNYVNSSLHLLSLPLPRLHDLSIQVKLKHQHGVKYLKRSAF